MDLGGVTAEFRLDAKGVAKTDVRGSKSNGFKLGVKYSKGVLQPGPAKFMLTMKNGNFQEELEYLGFENADTPKEGEQLDVPVVMTAGELVYIGMIKVTYKAKLNKSGKAQGQVR